MKTVRMNLYDCLKTVIGMTANVIVINRTTREIVTKHCAECNVEDDVYKKYWKLEVSAVTISDKYPNSIVIYVNDNTCESTIIDD